MLGLWLLSFFLSDSGHEGLSLLRTRSFGAELFAWLLRAPQSQRRVRSEQLVPPFEEGCDLRV